jgi:hypothetical protein
MIVKDSNNVAIDVNYIDKIVCEFWKVEYSDKEFASPDPCLKSWHHVLKCALCMLYELNSHTRPFNTTYNPQELIPCIVYQSIEYMCKDTEQIKEMVMIFKPYIDLCNHLSSLKLKLELL